MKERNRKSRLSVLQIRRGKGDNLRIIFQITPLTHILGPIIRTVSLRGETVLIMVTTYVFVKKYEKLSLNYPQYPLLSGALGYNKSYGTTYSKAEKKSFNVVRLSYA